MITVIVGTICFLAGAICMFVFYRSVISYVAETQAFVNAKEKALASDIAAFEARIATDGARLVKTVETDVKAVGDGVTGIVNTIEGKK